MHLHLFIKFDKLYNFTKPHHFMTLYTYKDVGKNPQVTRTGASVKLYFLQPFDILKLDRTKGLQNDFLLALLMRSNHGYL